MDESGRHPKFLYNRIDTATIVRKISEARECVSYIAPGVTTEIAKALQDAFLRVSGSVKIIVDVSTHAFTKGLNDIASMRELRQVAKNFSSSSRLDFRVETGIRMGVLDVDDETLVFVPSSVTLEDIDTPKTEAGFSVTGIQFPYENKNGTKMLGEKLLINAVFPGDETNTDSTGKTEDSPDTPESPTDTPESPKDILKSPKTKADQIKAFAKEVLPDIDNSKESELLPIQRNLEYVELSTSGTRITSCKLTMPVELLADVDPTIKERVEAKYKVFSQEDALAFNKEKMKITLRDEEPLSFSFEKFNKEIEELRRETKKIERIKSEEKKERVIRTSEKEVFQSKVNYYKGIASQLTEALYDYVNKKVYDRINEISDILCSDGTLDLFGEGRKNNGFIKALEDSAEKIMNNFQITVDFTTKIISHEDAQSDEFRRAVEKAFGKDVARELYGE